MLEEKVFKIADLGFMIYDLFPYRFNPKIFGRK